MLKTNREFYVIFQNRAGDKIKPQKRESPAQIGRVGMSDKVSPETKMKSAFGNADLYQLHMSQTPIRHVYIYH
jgi:hypothetical protein